LVALAAAVHGRSAGTLPSDWVRSFYEVLADVLTGGQRVVLFAELERGDGDTWDLAELLPGTGPMTIGVHARWGAGKSSFMRFVRWELLRGALAGRPAELAGLAEAEQHVEDATAVLRDSRADAAHLDAARGKLTAAVAERVRALDRLERAAAGTVLCVRFNAWRYEGATQIWAGLTHEITRAMEDSLPWWRRMATRVRYALREHRAGFWMGAAFGVAAAALLAGLALVLGFGAPGSALAEPLPAGLDVVAKLLPTGSVLAVGLLLAWRLSRGFVPVSGRIAQYLRQPDYREHMGYQHQVRRDIEFLKARRGGAGGSRASWCSSTTSTAARTSGCWRPCRRSTCCSPRAAATCSSASTPR
jgi:hypothetical protein